MSLLELIGIKVFLLNYFNKINNNKVFFNFILLSLYFSDIFCLSFILYLFIFAWVIYFKLGFITSLTFFNSGDKINTLSRNIKNLNFNIILRLNFLIIFLYFLFFFTFKYHNLISWWNHLKFNNFNLNITILILLINFFFLFLLNSGYFNSESYKYDFFFVLLNLSIFLVILFFSNTLFSFFFLLEVNSVLIFFKFLMSKTWYLNNNSSTLKEKQNSNSKIFLNMLFFQFWTAFFSSVLFVFSIILFLFTFGSTEWLFVNLLSNISNEFLLNSFFNYFITVVFIFAFFLKLGITPVHLYKIEIYKGINFISIFFYTTFYFFIFFLYFLIIVMLNLNSFGSILILIISLLLLFGTLYTISLLFDVSYIKAFLAYSSIINSLSFFIIILSIIS